MLKYQVKHLAKIREVLNPLTLPKDINDITGGDIYNTIIKNIIIEIGLVSFRFNNSSQKTSSKVKLLKTKNLPRNLENDQTIVFSQKFWCNKY